MVVDVEDATDILRMLYKMKKRIEKGKPRSKKSNQRKLNVSTVENKYSF